MMQSPEYLEEASWMRDETFSRNVKKSSEFFPPSSLAYHDLENWDIQNRKQDHNLQKKANMKTQNLKIMVILSLFKCLSDCCSYESNSFLLLVRSLRLIFLLSKWNAAQLNWDQLINSASQECSRSWSRKAAFYLVGSKIKSKSQCPTSTGSPTPGRTTFFGSGSLSPSTYVPLSKVCFF